MAGVDFSQFWIGRAVPGLIIVAASLVLFGDAVLVGGLHDLLDQDVHFPTPFKGNQNIVF